MLPQWVMCALVMPQLLWISFRRDRRLPEYGDKPRRKRLRHERTPTICSTYRLLVRITGAMTTRAMLHVVACASFGPSALALPPPLFMLLPAPWPDLAICANQASMGMALHVQSRFRLTFNY